MRVVRILLATTTVALACAGPATAENFEEHATATLRTLDKITGRVADVTVVRGEPVIIGRLAVDLSVCFQTPPEEPPESVAHLRIHAEQAADGLSDAARLGGAAGRPEMVRDEEPVFAGWMFASSPGLNALEHPVYDIWVIECRTPVPIVADGALEASAESTDLPNESETVPPVQP